MPDMGSWSGWGTALWWTLCTLALSWGIGRALSAIVMARVARRLPGQQHAWVQTAVLVVRRRLPLWSLLIGVWLAAGYWPLTTEGQVLVGRVVFVLGAASVTLAAATVAGRVVDSYGAVIAPALPVSSLTLRRELHHSNTSRCEGLSAEGLRR